MQKKLRDKDSELEVLKEMIRSAQLQAKGKDNEIQRLEKKIKRMVKEGYVEKMQAYQGPRAVNNNHLHQHAVQNYRQQQNSPIEVEDLEVQLNNTADMDQTRNDEEDMEGEEEGDFYDTAGLNERDEETNR